MGRVVKEQRLAIFDVLIREHRNVESLFDQIIAMCEQPDSESSRDLESMFEVLALKITSHNEIEDELVYERLEEVEELEPIMLKSREAHGAAERLLEELRGLESDDPVFAAKLQLLRDMFLQHKLEEEGPIFEAARNEIDAEESETLAREYLDEVLERTGEDPLAMQIVGEGDEGEDEEMAQAPDGRGRARGGDAAHIAR